MIRLKPRILPELVITAGDKISPELVKELNKMTQELCDDLHQGNFQLKFIPKLEKLSNGELVLTKKGDNVYLVTSVEGILYGTVFSNFEIGG